MRLSRVARVCKVRLRTRSTSSNTPDESVLMCDLCADSERLRRQENFAEKVDFLFESPIQSLTDGDVGICPSSDCKSNIPHIKLYICLSKESSRIIFMFFFSTFPTVPKQFIAVHLAAGIAQFLPCFPNTNLPISWRFSDKVLQPSPRHILLSQGLVVTPSFTDAGLYICETVEAVKGRVHRTAVVRYLVKVHNRYSPNRIQEIAISVSTAGVVMGALFMCRRCRQKFQNHVSCSNRGRDAGTEGTVATGQEERVETNNENSFTVQ
ncbi:hypothetical protein XENOCAPTIV_011174 [Xenoophorus captivus]|uniref:Ig-like domain-containing protein n=1 Tax=Xenoophorus captivus TaxID=1517983 RepID=A0ABV0QHR9_9TELE